MAKRHWKRKAEEASAKSRAGDIVAREQSAWRSRAWLWGALLVGAVILTYLPVCWAGYLWDDNYHLTDNPCIIGPLGVKEIWTTSAASICPLVLTMFWVEHAVWGLAPGPYHLVNILLHGACALVLWRVLKSLRIPGAWLGAALWALHPLQVESVAWISEMKNTQSCLFYLLTILFYIEWLKDRSGRHYIYTLLFAALAMTSKYSTVILPLVLCLIAWWVEGRWQWRQAIRLAPVWAMAAIISLITVWPGTADPAADGNFIEVRSWPQRVATAGDAIWFYLGKMVWPHPLITIYPRWQIDAGWWVSYLPITAAMLIFFILWIKRNSWGRPWFFASAYFLAALLPFLTLVEQSFWRYSFVEDHLQYLAAMGPLALAGAGLNRLATTLLPRQRALTASLCAGLLLILGLASWQRTEVYENEETLWSDTLEKNPNCWVGYNNVGNVYLQKGKMDEAMAMFQKALEINPNYADSYYNRGLAFLQKGEVDAAIGQYQKALEITPGDAKIHNNLGNAFVQKGEVDAAIEQFEIALKIAPENVKARNNFGNALFQKGRVDDAIKQFEKVLESKPDFVRARNNLGNAFLQKGELDKAIDQYQQALDMDPEMAEIHNNFGKALLQKGQLDQAIGQFQKALEINPRLDEVYYNLGVAFLNKGQLDGAMSQFQKALAINPNCVEVYNDLGVIFCKEGKFDEANVQFQEALRLKPDYVPAQVNLARTQEMMRQKKVSK